MDKDRDALLEEFQDKNGSPPKRGQLRIYFGYAAGVGKTCAMLNDAREAHKNGIDVVAGYIEPHDRPETAALLNGIESLSPLEISYRGISVKEFDLDTALKRKPELILVDELAHTNVQGCRHKKRFQDVEELLQAGIDVYTTVNVQHIESLNDVVEKITGIQVNERIPDSVFDSANQIELIDIEPIDLMERLDKGKIYKKNQAKRALNHFFTQEKLLALREIALRKTANQVNRLAANSEWDKNVSYSNEHILVCVSPAPTSAPVIRAAARMAKAFKATLTALYIEDRNEEEWEESEKKTLKENLRLAEQLGAQITTMYGDDVPVQIANYATISYVSKIVMGRSSISRRWKKASLVDVLSQLTPNIEIYIIPDSQPKEKKTNKSYFKKPPTFSLEDTLKTILILILCTLIGLAFDYWQFNIANIITVYILGLQLNAVVTKGRVYSVVSSLLSIVTFNFFFTEPRYTLEANNASYPMTFVVMLVAGLLTSTLTKRIQEHSRQTAEKAYRTEILLETNQKLQNAGNKKEILIETSNQLVKLLHRDVIVYPVINESLSEPLFFSVENGDNPTQISLDDKEKAVAEWVLKNNKRAGATTNTLSGADYLYMSVRSNDKVLAIIGISMVQERELDVFDKNILIAILGECSLAMQKELLREKQSETASQMKQEQLRSNLLRAISHDLRTPLTSISGNAKFLRESESRLTKIQRQELFTHIYDDSMWLINLVENLLSLTKLDNGGLSLKLEEHIIEEVFTEARRHLDRKSVYHQIRVHPGEELLVAKMDSQLLVQVLVNIINNAIKYTNEGSIIEICAQREGDNIRIEVLDDGPGISDEEKGKIFEQFYTTNTVAFDSRRGLGLGLSLCKSIIQAHGGEIYVKDNKPKGTVIGFTLQAVEVNLD